MLLQHKKQTIYPDIKTKDSKETAKTVDDSFRVNKDALGRIYDDLSNLNDTLPDVAGVLYFGDSATDGTWRIIVSGVNLSVQLRVAGSYVEKSAFTP